MNMLNGLTDNKAMQTIRARVAFHTRQHGFDRAAKQLVEGASPAVTDGLVADLYASWGDPLSQVDERFMRSCLAEAQKCTGAILQCGTSLLTLLLGAVCDQSEDRAKQLWCLEHDRHWSNLIRSWLTEYRVRKAHIIHSRARMYQDYVWYSLNPTRLAKSYDLVLCDGARSTPQGIVGTLTRLSKLLGTNFVILARNVTNPTDVKFIHVWAKSRGATCAIVDKKDGFIKICTPQKAEELPLPEAKTGPTALKNSRANGRPKG